MNFCSCFKLQVYPTLKSALMRIIILWSSDRKWSYFTCKSDLLVCTETFIPDPNNIFWPAVWVAHQEKPQQQLPASCCLFHISFILYFVYFTWMLNVVMQTVSFLSLFG